MPVNWNSHLKRPGDTINLPDDWDNLFGAVESVLGAGGAGQGVQNEDIPEGANIPNSAIDNQVAYSVIVWDADQDWEMTDGAELIGTLDQFPPTNIVHTGHDMTIVSYRYYARVICGIAIAVDQIVVWSFSLSASAHLSPMADFSPQIEVNDGQTLTICTYEDGDEPAVGEKITTSAERALHIELVCHNRMSE